MSTMWGEVISYLNQRIGEEIKLDELSEYLLNEKYLVRDEKGKIHNVVVKSYLGMFRKHGYIMGERLEVVVPIKKIPGIKYSVLREL